MHTGHTIIKFASTNLGFPFHTEPIRHPSSRVTFPLLYTFCHQPNTCIADTKNLYNQVYIILHFNYLYLNSIVCNTYVHFKVNKNSGCTRSQQEKFALQRGNNRARSPHWKKNQMHIHKMVIFFTKRSPSERQERFTVDTLFDP